MRSAMRPRRARIKADSSRACRGPGAVRDRCRWSHVPRLVVVGRSASRGGGSAEGRSPSDKSRAGTAGRAESEKRQASNPPVTLSSSSPACPALPALRADSYCTAIQLKLPVSPLAPFVSRTSRITCWPADSAMPVLDNVRHVCQLPVSGTVIGPVLSTPFTSM
jgi:hypothetical protein